MLKVLCVCGARPNFMKIAPMMDALAVRDGVAPMLVHTGQHYDDRMSELFFGDLGIPKPDINLEVGSLSHAAQTAEIMKRFEPICVEHKPDWVVVVGDVNSTIACALVARKLGIRVAHVEAGLRSFDRDMPEEINRILTDTISDKLFVTEKSGLENLKNEGIPASRVHLVGNVMIDTLLKSRARAEKSTILTALELTPKKYVAVTLHRPSNVDNKEQFGAILAAFEQIAEKTPIVFPVHPRTRKNIAGMGLAGRIDAIANLKMIEPLGYLDFMKLMSESAAMLTDSGGIQEETTILGVPCLTLRKNTERPITIEQGTNRLIGCDTKTIVDAFAETQSHPPVGKTPDLWDGKAATRIVELLVGASL